MLRVKALSESGTGRVWTADTRIFSPLLYQLSYSPFQKDGKDRRFLDHKQYRNEIN